MEIIRHCLVCGKEFKACNTCQQNTPETLQWRRVVCCPAHFAYHIPIIMYHNGEYSKDKARTELQNAIDAYGDIEYCDNVKAIVDEILADDVKSEPETDINNIKVSDYNVGNNNADEIIQDKPSPKTKKNRTKFVKE